MTVIADAPDAPDELVGLVDATEDPALLLARDGTVLRINEAAAAVLDVPAAQLLGARLGDVLGTSRVATFRDALAAVWRTGEPRRVEGFSATLDGWYRAEVIRFGERVLARFWDVSERRRTALVHALRDRLAADIGDGRGPLDTVIRAATTLQELPDVDLAEVWIRSRSGGAVERAHRWTSAGLDAAPDGTAAAGWWDDEVVAALAEPAPREVSAGDADATVRTIVLVPLVVAGSDPAVLVLGTRADPPEVDHLGVVRAVHDDLVALVGRQREWRDLSRLFRLSTELLAVVRRDGTFSRVNPALTELLGYPEGALLGRPVFDFLHPDDVAPTALAIARTVRGETPGRFTNRYVTATGDVRTLWWAVGADRADEVAYVAGRDVTERERENALVVSQRDVLRELAEGASAISALELLARALEVRLPGAWVSVQRAEASGQRLRNLVAPSLPTAFLAAVAELPVGPDGGVCGSAAEQRDEVVVADLRTDERVAGFRELAAEHGLGSCWSAPLIASDGALLGTFAIYRATTGEPDATERQVVSDVSGVARLVLERERDAGRLTASEERFRLLAQATSDAMWDLDLRAGTLWWGDGLQTLFGYDLQQVEPDLRSWVRRIHPDDRDEVLGRAEAALANDASIWSATYRFLRADGTSAHVLDRGMIIRDAHGTAVRMVGGMVDQTEQRQLEAQYLRAQRMESVGRLAGGIAHDLNNALAPVLMAAELLAGTSLSDEQEDHVRTITDSAQHGADVVRQVLTFARGVAGDRVPVDARELLTGLARMVTDTFPKDLRVETDVVGDPVLLGDAVQLQQVLLNLAVNARDAMTGGGTLRLRADQVDVDEAYIAMRPDVEPGRYVRLAVSDTGAGIPPELLARVTEPFFSTKDDAVGTGLGLATSAAIVTSHGGFLDLDSEVGRGTTVTVHVPVSRGEPDPQRDPEEAAGALVAGGADRLVLVVDDETNVREVTCRTLERHGYRCLEARDGAEAVARFASHRGDIAVVLTDLMMPVMDGASLVAALRRLEPQLPMLAVSGLADAAKLDGQLPDDVAVLRKPFGARTLLAALEQLLDDDRSPSR